MHFKELFKRLKKGQFAKILLSLSMEPVVFSEFIFLEWFSHHLEISNAVYVNVTQKPRISCKMTSFAISRPSRFPKEAGSRGSLAQLCSTNLRVVGVGYANLWEPNLSSHWRDVGELRSEEGEEGSWCTLQG